MRFIHTSDWHIGRQFHGQSLLDDQRHVLEQLLGYIGEYQADALVIAGDIYDRSVPPAKAVSLLDEVLHRVCHESGIPVLLIPGNHDSAERLSFGARQLRQAGLHIFGDLQKVAEPVTIKGVSFFGIPYNDPELVRSVFGCDRASQKLSTHDDAHRYLIERINEAGSDVSPRVLISHCFIDGAEESDSERPLSIGGADRVSYRPFLDFDYVALGHLHGPQYRGSDHIRYAGSILKYSFSEQHQKKAVTLVEIDEQRSVTTTQLPLKPLRDMRVLEGELVKILQQGASDPCFEDYLLVRLTDRHAILDPMGKLREVYPNVLHLEKLGLLMTGEQQLQREQLKRNEQDMFADFYKQMSGQDLTPDQTDALERTLAGLHKNQEGAE